jgi:hypothetical protein
VPTVVPDVTGATVDAQHPVDLTAVEVVQRVVAVEWIGLAGRPARQVGVQPTLSDLFCILGRESSRRWHSHPSCPPCHSRLCPTPASPRCRARRTSCPPSLIQAQDCACRFRHPNLCQSAGQVPVKGHIALRVFATRPVPRLRPPRHRRLPGSPLERDVISQPARLGGDLIVAVDGRSRSSKT